MTYEEKPKTIEAWKVGSNPIDSWVQILITNKTVIQKKLDDGREYIVVILPQEKLVAERNDYLIKSISQTGDNVLSVMGKDLFERLYKRTGAN